MRWNLTLPVAYLGAEGGVYASSELVGELTLKGVRVANASVCTIRADGSGALTCTVTNRFGQYFLSVPPGTYDVTVDDQRGLKSKRRLDMNNAGEYRNRITL